MNGDDDAVDHARDDVAPETTRSTTAASAATRTVSHAPRCVSCGAARTGPYCAQCGQRELRGRHTLRGVAATFLGRVLDVDHGLLHTVHWLTVRPDRVVRDYLAGRTVPYTNPVAYLLLCFAAFAIAVGVFGGATGSEDDRVLTALAVPFIAAVSRLLFWRTRLNYAEHLVLVLYFLGHVALILAVLQAVLLPALHGDPGPLVSGIVAFGALGIAIGYFGWAFSRVFPARPWLAAAGGLAALAGGAALWAFGLIALLRALHS